MVVEDSDLVVSQLVLWELKFGQTLRRMKILYSG